MATLLKRNLIDEILTHIKFDLYARSGKDYYYDQLVMNGEIDEQMPVHISSGLSSS